MQSLKGANMSENSDVFSRSSRELNDNGSRSRAIVFTNFTRRVMVAFRRPSYNDGENAPSPSRLRSCLQVNQITFRVIGIVRFETNAKLSRVSSLI